MIHPVLRDTFRESDHKHDPWGSALMLTFSICDVLYVHGEDIPDDWEFRPGIFGTAVDPDDIDAAYMDELYRDGKVTGDDLRHYGNVLVRYTRIMDTMGRSY